LFAYSRVDRSVLDVMLFNTVVKNVRRNIQKYITIFVKIKIHIVKTASHGKKVVTSRFGASHFGASHFGAVTLLHY